MMRRGGSWRDASLKQADNFLGATQAGLARARFELARGDGAGAQRLLDPLLAREPDNLRLLVAMGGAMTEQGQYAEALRFFQKALAEQPENPQIKSLVALRSAGSTATSSRCGF